MVMEPRCPRCQTANVSVARFCGRCGLSLTAGGGGHAGPGRVRHPRPVAPPDGFVAILGAEHLDYHWGSAWGDRFLLGTEGIAVALFNGAYPLREVVLDLRGQDAEGKELFVVEERVEELPVGRQVKVQIPSYELPNPVAAMTVRLASAEFDRQT